ncbi:hypothetical protein VNO77_08436 [Canavalia gladiata]|uniref:Uncharacterized protein n=1 Tax=Canavalia gladiata TaxID=3824 RepID=A0AAN9M8J4_CANGL
MYVVSRSTRPDIPFWFQIGLLNWHFHVRTQSFTISPLDTSLRVPWASVPASCDVDKVPSSYPEFVRILTFLAAVAFAYGLASRCTKFLPTEIRTHSRTEAKSNGENLKLEEAIRL